MNIPLRQYWQLLVAYLKQQRWRMLLLAVLLFSAIGLQLLNPQIIRSFIDTARAGGAAAVLLNAALLFIGVAVAQQVLSVSATYLGENIGWTATNALRMDLTRHCLKLDMTFHNARTPGELIERIDGDVTVLANFFSQFVIQVAGNTLLLVGVLGIFCFEDWRLGVAMAVFVAIVLLIMGRLRNVSSPYWEPGGRPAPTSSALWRSGWLAWKVFVPAARRPTRCACCTVIFATCSCAIARRG